MDEAIVVGARDGADMVRVGVGCFWAEGRAFWCWDGPLAVAYDELNCCLIASAAVTSFFWFDLWPWHVDWQEIFGRWMDPSASLRVWQIYFLLVFGEEGQDFAWHCPFSPLCGLTQLAPRRAAG